MEIGKGTSSGAESGSCVKDKRLHGFKNGSGQFMKQKSIKGYSPRRC